MKPKQDTFPYFKGKKPPGSLDPPPHKGKKPSAVSKSLTSSNNQLLKLDAAQQLLCLSQASEQASLKQPTTPLQSATPSLSATPPQSAIPTKPATPPKQAATSTHSDLPPLSWSQQINDDLFHEMDTYSIDEDFAPVPLGENNQASSNLSGWQIPRKRQIAHAKITQSPMTQLEDSSKNQFSLLKDLKINANKRSAKNPRLDFIPTQTTINDPPPRDPHTKNAVLDEAAKSGETMDSSATNNITNAVRTEEKLLRGKFCPPIIMTDVNVRQLICDLKEKSLSFNYKLVYRGPTCRFYVDNPSIHKELLLALRSNEEVQAYSFTCKEEKTTNLVLRGLTTDYLESEILDELRLRAPCVDKVSKFETIRSRQLKLNYNLFLVRLLPGSGASAVNNIKFLFNTKISWEKPKGNDGPLQCRRCQQFGHLAKNCANSYKCVKCTGTHDPGACPSVRSETSKAKCVNCGDDHSANFRGCKAFKEFKSKRDRALLQTKNKRQSNSMVSKAVINSELLPGISYASHFSEAASVPKAAKPKITFSQSSSKNNNVIHQFMDLSKDLFGIDMGTLVNKIEDFMSNLNNFTSIVNKKLAYLDLVNQLLVSSTP